MKMKLTLCLLNKMCLKPWQSILAAAAQSANAGQQFMANGESNLTFNTTKSQLIRSPTHRLNFKSRFRRILWPNSKPAALPPKWRNNRSWTSRENLQRRTLIQCYTSIDSKNFRKRLEMCFFRTKWTSASMRKVAFQCHLFLITRISKWRRMWACKL